MKNNKDGSSSLLAERDFPLFCMLTSTRESVHFLNWTLANLRKVLRQTNRCCSDLLNEAPKIYERRFKQLTDGSPTNLRTAQTYEWSFKELKSNAPADLRTALRRKYEWSSDKPVNAASTSLQTVFLNLQPAFPKNYQWSVKRTGFRKKFDKPSKRRNEVPANL